MHAKLRCDLVISRQESPGGVVYVVKDPRIGRFVRFKEPEYFIARQLDGATAPEEIRRRGEQHLGATLSESTLARFTAKLQTLGLLETGAGQERQPAAGRRGGWVRGNFFYLRLKVIDPDGFLARLVPRTRFFFTPYFAWFSLGLMLLAAGVLVGRWQELHASFAALYRPETIPLAWLTLLGIVIGHEFSHGLACKRFGGSVHEVGLLLIYLQPAMYCNVSDAWLFPEKRQRLLVTLAGAWFELFVWALATLCWRVTEPGTAPNYLALLIATTLGIKTLFNLNPLIKLDGYYLLSDWLELPNLRRNAFRHIGACLGRWRRPPEPAPPGRGGAEGKVNPVEAGSPGETGDAAAETDARRAREHRIFWLYGLLAATYSVWLISFLLLSLGRFLVAKYQSWGFVLFAALVGAIFRRPLGRGLRRFGSQFSPKRGMLRAMKRLAKVAAVLAALGATLYFIKTELRVSGEFRIRPLQNAEVRAEVEGIVEEVARDENDLVKPGDLIARLSDRDYRADLQKINAEIAEKEAKLRMLKAGARPEELELARTALNKCEERVKYAQYYFEIEKKLYQENLSSQKDLELAAETAALRQKELEESKGNLKLLLAGSRPEEIEATQAEITRLASQQTYLQEQLRRLRILSPIAGVVTAHRLKDKTGATVKKGDLITEVQQLKSVSAEISIPEQEISEVKPGQRVILKARAHVGASFAGTVAAIAPVATQPAEGIAQRNFVVTTHLDNADLRLRGEMSGNAKIYCGSRRLYEVVFRRFIRFIRVEFWSWW